MRTERKDRKIKVEGPSNRKEPDDNRRPFFYATVLGTTFLFEVDYSGQIGASYRYFVSAKTTHHRDDQRVVEKVSLPVHIKFFYSRAKNKFLPEGYGEVGVSGRLDLQTLRELNRVFAESPKRDDLLNYSPV
jgi:hypothetical protein